MTLQETLDNLESKLFFKGKKLFIIIGILFLVISIIGVIIGTTSNNSQKPVVSKIASTEQLISEIKDPNIARYVIGGFWLYVRERNKTHIETSGEKADYPGLTNFFTKKFGTPEERKTEGLCIDGIDGMTEVTMWVISDNFLISMYYMRDPGFVRVHFYWK